MSTHDRQPGVVASLNALLDGLVWNTATGAYVEGQVAAVLIDPVPNDAGTAFAVPISATVFTELPTALEGTQIVLNAQAETCPQIVRFGTLDAWGQVVFQDLRPGTYHTAVHAPGRLLARTDATLAPVPSTTLPVLRPIPAMVVERAAAATSARSHEHGGALDTHAVFRDAAGSLVATVWSHPSGEVEVDLEILDRAWDGALVGLTWQARTPGQGSTGGEEQFLLAPLSWSDLAQSCVAEMRLGRFVNFAIGLTVPSQRLPLSAITDDLLDILRESVARSASDHTRDAWRHLLAASTGDALSPSARAALEEALDGLPAFPTP